MSKWGLLSKGVGQKWMGRGGYLSEEGVTVKIDKGWGDLTERGFWGEMDW